PVLKTVTPEPEKAKVEAEPEPPLKLEAVEPANGTAPTSEEAAPPVVDIAAPTSEVERPAADEIAGLTSEVIGPPSEIAGLTNEVTAPTTEVLGSADEITAPISEVEESTDEIPGPTSEIAQLARVAGLPSEIAALTSEIPGPTSEIAQLARVAGPTSEIAGLAKAAGPPSEIGQLAKAAEPTSEIETPPIEPPAPSTESAAVTHDLAVRSVQVAPPATHQAYWLLSVFTPAASDQIDWASGNYSTLTRRGRIESTAGWGELKQPTPMVAEGSVLVCGSEPQGAVRDTAPAGFAHPVFRAGFAVALPLKTRPA
ncbi:MAG TPA: hypothetical protein VKG25_10945, partial [Bryobacteraceae bacterium]|nr:hypothetical protein [Bryobacteraceae bacterium]